MTHFFFFFFFVLFILHYHRAFTNHFVIIVYFSVNLCSLLQLLYKVRSLSLTTQLNRWCLSNCHNQREGPVEGGVHRRRRVFRAMQPGFSWRVVNSDDMS